MPALTSTAQADCIVSDDDDLLVLTRYQGIDIVTPAQAPRLITSGQEARTFDIQRLYALRGLKLIDWN